MANKATFIQRSRGLAAAFISAANEFHMLGELLNNAGMLAETGDSALVDGTDFQAYPGLDRAKMIAFYATLTDLFAPLTAEQKEAIYALFD